MISKKSRKVVAALLIGATVCASGTFAYFNQKIDLSKISSVKDGTDQTLQITNGKIEISAKFAGTNATDLANVWTYDVAKVSTAKELIKSDSTKLSDLKARLATTATVADKTADNFQIAETVKNIADDANYILKHRTPDLNVVNVSDAGATTGTSKFDTADYSKEVNDIDRLKIGTKIPSKVTFARPGDAFVLGYVDGTTTPEDAGIEIVNKSNLTTKIGVGLNPGKKGDYAEVKAEIAKLNANGWRAYIRIIDATTKKGIGDYGDWTEITDAVSKTSDKICEVATVAPNTGVNPLIQLRVELPLLTDNSKQDLTTGQSTTDGTAGTFDITSLFEIVATQENNPGWNQLGSSDRPIETTTPATK